MVLRNIEQRLERLVEGMFARAFRSGLQPVEIGRRLIRELDSHRTLDVSGRPVGPNRFGVRLATEDYQKLMKIRESLVRELSSSVREHAREEGMLFLGRVAIEIFEDPKVHEGMFRVDSSFDETAAVAAPPAYLELPDGQRVELSQRIAKIGRLPESDVILDDPNASRNHAELHPEGDTYLLVDLGSTNGSKINGVRANGRLLADGDELTFGIVSLVFRQL